MNKVKSFVIRSDYTRTGKEKNMGGIIATGESVIDSGLVTELVNLVKTVMGLFSEFPLNVLLIASLCFVAFGLFSRAKRAAM